MFVATWLMRAMVADLHPLTQLLICAPVGVLTGIAFICMFQPQRKVAIQLFEIVREFKEEPVNEIRIYRTAIKLAASMSL